MYSLSVPQKPGLLLLLIFQIAFGADVSAPVAQVLRTSRQLIDEKRYKEAISLLDSNRTQSVKQNDQHSEALILNVLGVAYEQQGMYVAARNAFDGSISRLTRAEGKDTPELVPPLNNLANLLYESDQNLQAEALVRRSLGILRAAGAPDADTGQELAILAKMYLGERKLSLAQKSAQESLELLRQSSRPEELSAAVAWSVLGAVYDVHRDSERAEDSLKQTLSILQKDLDPQDFRLGEAIANLGLLYADQGLSEKANPLLEQARACFRGHAVNSLFVRTFLLLWADMERRAGHKDKAKDLTTEAKTLMASRTEASMSGSLVDANAFR